MGEIYENAERVVTWLGSEQDSSGEVLETLDALRRSLSTEDEFEHICSWFFGNIRSDFVYHLTQLMTRRYSNRIWIAQELAMTDERSITICGPRRFSTLNLLTFGARILSSVPQWFVNPLFELGAGSDPEGDRRGISVSFLNSGIARLRDLCALQRNLESNRSET